VTSRILFTAKQKDELWERWKNGQSVLAISRALERGNKTGVQRIVALNGGIAPAPRCRAVAALKLEERQRLRCVPGTVCLLLPAQSIPIGTQALPTISASWSSSWPRRTKGVLFRNH
jgi:hypothetical protein